MAIRDFYSDVDLKANQLFNSRLHNVTTAARVALGLGLTTSSKGYMVYDTDLSSPYFWNGTQWLAAGGGGGAVWGAITGTITAQTDLTSYLSTNYYSVTNPAGYITSSALSPYLTSATAASTYEPIIAAGTASQYWRGDKTWQTFPTIPAAQIQSDWNQTNNTLLDYIKNKPTIPTVGTWGALNYPTWTSGTPFVKMNAAGSFTLDTTSYQPLLTNPVTGTGTATRVAFWDTGSSISSDSDLYWDNSAKRLGIGTVTPAYKLDVNGSESIAGYLNFKQSASVTSIRIGSNDLENGGASPNNDRLVLIGNNVATSLSTKISNNADSLIAIGYGAAYTTTSGGLYSVYIGRNAGGGITTGEFNTHIGSGDTSNIPSGTGYSIHINAGGGYEFNNATRLLSGLTSKYAFIGGGYNSAGYINDFYLGAGAFVTEPQQANLSIYAPSSTTDNTVGGSWNGTDAPGSNFTINAGRGTGTGTPGDFIVKTATKTTSGNTLQTLAQRVKVAGDTGEVTVNNLATGGADQMVTVDTNGVLKKQTIPSTSGGILHGTASGTDTYTATIGTASSYADGDAFLIRFTNGNTGTSTLNINGIGAVDLYRNNDGPVLGGDIVAGGEMLCVYDGTTSHFQVIGVAPNTLIGYVTNGESITINKGQAVYAYSGTGDRMVVKLAYNTGDSTSAQTVGLVMSSSIGANQKGLIMMQGLLDGLSTLPTSTYNDGDAVYLGTTAGSITNVKPYAPNHLVYLGVVTTASPGAAGRMYVRVQNGYELDELHNVQAQSPSLKDTLWYDNGVSPAQWKTASIPTILGYTPVAPTDTDYEYLMMSSFRNTYNY